MSNLMRMRRHAASCILLLLAMLATITAAQEGKHDHAWGYEGPEGPAHWGDLKPDYSACKAGRQQSPIDIRHPKEASLPPLQFAYHPAPLNIINNGHTIQINYAPGSFLTVGDKHYQLKQFHFHHPSEEHINGKPQDMVAHLVHADPDGHLAVVAVLLGTGSANTMIQRIWDHLPRTEGKEEEVSGVEVDAAALLPPTTAYYTFAGSLTTPPCSEQVTWFVLKTPTQISAEEVAAFAKLYPHNARPTQPLNGREVLESR